MLKFKIKFILQLISYEVIMPSNIYLSGPFSYFLYSHEILHQSTCAYTPQHNRVVEHKNRHLVETARTLLLHHNVPQHF